MYGYTVSFYGMKDDKLVAFQHHLSPREAYELRQRIVRKVRSVYAVTLPTSYGVVR